MLNPKMEPAAVPPQAAAPRSALRERLLDPRTLISFGILAVVLFVVLTHVQLDYGESLRAITQTNLLLYALAFAAFYRAYLLRQQTEVSGSKGLGTIFSERALDFLVLMSLLIVSGLISFRASVPERFL